MISMSLLSRSSLLKAYASTTALDVTTQANILDLIMELQDYLEMAVMFITHDLGVVAEIADRVAVMYLGRIVELARSEQIYSSPRHPYTEALLSAAPEPDPGARKRRLLLEGDVPSPLDPPSGCAFHPRCPISEKGLCDREVPALRSLAEGHAAACHLAR